MPECPRLSLLPLWPAGRPPAVNTQTTYNRPCTPTTRRRQSATSADARDAHGAADGVDDEDAAKAAFDLVAKTCVSLDGGTLFKPPPPASWFDASRHMLAWFAHGAHRSASAAQLVPLAAFVRRYAEAAVAAGAGLPVPVRAACRRSLPALMALGVAVLEASVRFASPLEEVTRAQHLVLAALEVCVRRDARAPSRECLHGVGESRPWHAARRPRRAFWYGRLRSHSQRSRPHV